MVDIEHIKKISFFSNLQEETLKELASIASFRKYSEGQILFYEKEDQKEVYYITKGSIKFYKVDRFDSEIFLYKQGTDSLIYNVSKLCQEYTISCYSNAEFLEDSEIIVFNSLKFQEVMKNNQDFMRIILRESFRMIQKLQCIISRDVVFDGTAKVAHMLINDLENFNRLKKHEIAYMLHIQPETLSRILKKLTRNEIIKIERNSVVIVDADELRNIYE